MTMDRAPDGLDGNAFGRWLKDRNRYAFLWLLGILALSLIITKWADETVWAVTAIEPGVWELRLPSNLDKVQIASREAYTAPPFQCAVFPSLTDAQRWWRGEQVSELPGTSCTPTPVVQGRTTFVVARESTPPAQPPQPPQPPAAPSVERPFRADGPAQPRAAISQTSVFLVVYESHDGEHWRPDFARNERDLTLTSVSWWKSGQPVENLARADTCASKSDMACRYVARLLPRSQLATRRGPEGWIGYLIEASAGVGLVSALLYGMMIVNGLLFGRLVGFFLGAFRMTPELLPSEENKNRDHAPVLDTETVWHRQRRLYEWLEVSGPALGFLLTVTALIQAFKPEVFATRDVGRFTSAIGNAFAATAAGLCMRILAFSCDRLLVHRARWKADQNGYREWPRPRVQREAVGERQP